MGRGAGPGRGRVAKVRDDAPTKQFEMFRAGKCLSAAGGVMCPCYRVTHDEKHSTRSRARLLFKMASGQLVTGGRRT